jgi:Domain of unknown function (DUF5710)
MAAGSARIDLYVSPEEYAAVRSLGARWDAQRKCWYLDDPVEAARFARWLGDAAPEPEAPWNIRAHEAFVASAARCCRRCGLRTAVLCLYCRCGSAWGEPLQCFTLQNIQALDAHTVRQLRHRAGFRFDRRERAYVNHCMRCDAVLPDALLHSEPHHPFYDVRAWERAGPGKLLLTPLEGPLAARADYSVEV